MARAKNTLTVARNVGLILGLTVGLAACSTVQENPNYQYSTKYQGAADTSYASNGAATTPATYTQVSSQPYTGQTYSGSSASREADARCRNKESNREIIGGAAGGTLGAVIGNKVIGGTKGTIAGAVVGGAAGFGLGDISVDCSPSQTYQPAPVQAAPTQASAQVYQSAPTDALYVDQSVNGTPGYEVYQGQRSEIYEGTINPSTVTISGPVHSASSSAPVQGYAQNISNGAVEVSNYDYSANLISADTPVDTGAYLAVLRTSKAKITSMRIMALISGKLSDYHKAAANSA